MAATEIVRARIDAGLKADATGILAEMGLTVSDAIRLMLIRVVADKALPFEVRAPNPVTAAAMDDAVSGKVQRFDTVDSLLADLKTD